MTWTRFMDMHSGGRQKLNWEKIYIEAPESEAKSIFYSRFKRNPERVTCTCCGDDYGISSAEDFAQLSAFDRGCQWAHPDTQDIKTQNRQGRYLEPDEVMPDGWIASKYSAFHKGPIETIEQYMAREDVLVIPADEIKFDERKLDVPAEGYQWVG